MNILDNIMCQFWKSDLPPSDFAFVSDFVVVVTAICWFNKCSRLIL